MLSQSCFTLARWFSASPNPIIICEAVTFELAPVAVGFGASQDFARAIGLPTDNAEAHLYRGKALVRLDNHDAAVRNFDRAIELDPGDAESYYERGLAHVALGD